MVELKSGMYIKYFTLSTLGKNFSKRHFDTFFLFSLRKEVWDFAWNVKFCFLGKNKKNVINLSAADKNKCPDSGKS